MFVCRLFDERVLLATMPSNNGYDTTGQQHRCTSGTVTQAGYRSMPCKASQSGDCSSPDVQSWHHVRGRGCQAAGTRLHHRAPAVMAGMRPHVLPGECGARCQAPQSGCVDAHGQGPGVPRPPPPSPHSAAGHPCTQGQVSLMRGEGWEQTAVHQTQLCRPRLAACCKQQSYPLSFYPRAS